MNIPIYNWYVKDDTVCPETANIPVGDMIPTQDTSMLWTNGSLHSSFIGQVTDTYYDPLIRTLGNEAVLLDEVCGAINFGTWV